ncbi:hypothetical protein BJX99DRAFT_219553 [Aspergillus californicus]
MPPLRPHTKSRNGCVQCKKRRVKCDERGHPCGNCAFRKTECTYPNASTASSSPGLSPSSASQGADEHVHVEHPLAPLDSSSTLMLELMHKFSTETYKSFFSEPGDYHVWQFTIPQLAFRHEFLLYGLLSVAALHTAFAGTRSARSYIDTAMVYQSRASAPFHDAIRNISHENCDAVFAYSMIITVNGIAMPQLSVDKSDKVNILDTIFMVFELVQGTAEISKIGGPWLQRSCLVQQDYWGKSSETLDGETDRALTRLSAMNDEENRHNADRHRFIEYAISRLRLCFHRFRGLGDPASVLTWLATVDRDFVNCLRRHETLPLVVLLHWGVLLGQLDGKVWWASNSGEALVSDTMRILKNKNAKLGDVASWPKRVLGLQLDEGS